MVESWIQLLINLTDSCVAFCFSLSRIVFIFRTLWKRIIRDSTDFFPQAILLHYIFSSGSCPLKRKLYPGCLNETHLFSLQTVDNYCLPCFLPLKENWACFLAQAHLVNNFFPIFCNLFTQERSEMSYFYANYMQTLTQYFSFQKTANIVAGSR